ncbi:hypothetical protein JSQ81_15460 [Sporosarcina sp. Marseille-Q4063]|uniref:hypothetical protein n=1 Tax=Sporosarcina sp. Marseille-Q4063 TaxID=2810514 RepID=UPI001BAF37DF|nr:hypothetical protein [Sporosarcina sp. Marseille-Q4063]QUW21193.1 hypothetical protein JSQ81_15460 [Sporosarcina sp. Marseille-Q4063]
MAFSNQPLKPSETTKVAIQTTKAAAEATKASSQTTNVAAETTKAVCQTTKVSKKVNRSALFVEAGTYYGRNTYCFVQILQRLQTTKVASETTKEPLETPKADPQTTNVALETPKAASQTTKVSKKVIRSALFVEAGTALRQQHLSLCTNFTASSNDQCRPPRQNSPSNSPQSIT